MIAFRDIKLEMRDACRAVTHPATMAGTPARVARGDFGDEAPETHIEPWMAAAFAELVRAYDTNAPFALVSCFMNGKPATLIAYLSEDGNRRHVTPLFVAVQSGMVFTPHTDEVVEAV